MNAMQSFDDFYKQFADELADFVSQPPQTVDEAAHVCVDQIKKIVDPATVDVR